MNHDDPQFPSSDEILEARIVAWVLGEASPFEVAELTRVLSEKPALQEFKKRIEAVHGLLGEAIGPTAPLQISPARRRELLGKLGISPASTAAPEGTASSINASNTSGQATQEPNEKRAPLFVYPVPASRRVLWMKGLSIACSLLLAFMIVKVTFFTPRTGELYQAGAAENAQKRSVELTRRAPPMKGELVAIDAPQDQKESAIPIALPSSTAEVTFSASSPPIPPAKESFDEVAPEGDQPVILDPFVVEASEDTGSYGASSTLAGTRLQTELKVEIPQLKFPSNAKSVVGERKLREGIKDFGKSTLAIRVAALDESEELASSASPPPAFAPKPKSFFPTAADDLSVRANYETSSITGEPKGHNGINDFGKDALADSLSQSVSAANSRSSGTVYSLPRADGPRTNSILFGRGSPNKITATSDRDESIVLSPFVVDDKSTAAGGVSANSTLAGTRIRTDLRDASSAISTVTRQFTASTTPANAKRAIIDEENLKPAGSYLESSPPVAGGALAKKEAPAAPIALRSELTASAESVSTFSLHVSDVSFRLAVASMARGERPDPASIRPEEFYNAFDYGDPAASPAEQVSCRIEQSAHPELQQRNLVRIAVRVPATGRVANQPLRLTVLLDTSGSMQRDDRAAAVRRAMQVLVSLLGPADRITLIGFSRTPRLLAESVSGDQASALLKIVAQTPAEGGTNLEAALNLAEQLAQRQHDASAQNRIVLLTDGAANLGNANPAQLAAQVVKFRQEGIAFDACGVGTDGVDDAMLEALTRDGDGRYTLLSDADASVDEFARQLAGAFRPAAKNVKVQVRFNPARVGHYRLIGFEQHRLKTEDFRNDQVDAAELAADEAAIAVYQVEPLPQGEGELGEVFVRFQDTATDNMIERSWALPYDAHAAAFDRASPTMQLAGAAALVAETLQGELVRLEVLRGPMNTLRNHYKNEAAVQNLVTLYNELRRVPDGK